LIYSYWDMVSFKGGGSSSDPCNDKYHGPGPVSEPETQNTVNYFRWL